METKHYAIPGALFLAVIILFVGRISSADESAGRIIFKGKCQVCHMIEGDGNYASAYYKQYRPKDFSKSISWGKLNEEKIRGVLTKGQGVMRPVLLTADETKALVYYMMKDLKK